MFQLLLLVIFSAASALDAELSIECPTCVIVNTTCYNVSHVLEFEAPFRNKVVISKLGILRAENLLFFAFEPKFEDLEYSKVGFVNLEAHNVTGIIASDKLIVNFETFDIDQDNAVIYFGGSDGIFSLDTKTNSLGPYSSRGDRIWYIFFKNYVYFAKYDDDEYNLRKERLGNKGIIVKKGDSFRSIFENTSIRQFVINKYDVVVFINKFGLHVGKGESTRRLSRNGFFRGIAMDLDGNIYTWWVDGIYRVFVERDINAAKVERVAEMEAIGAITFDNDNNMLFTSSRGLYRLTQLNYDCQIRK